MSALYCIEDIEFMDYDRINRMWMRHHGIPWTITVTGRLIIREQTEDDLAGLYGIYDDDEIRKFVEPLYEDREKEREYMRDYIANQYRFHEYGLWALTLKDGGELIGRAGFSVREGYDIPELGYVIGRDHRRRGYAAEALGAIMDYGREELGLCEYVAFCDSANTASARLLESLGFSRSGSDQIMGRIHDRYLLTLKQ
jgi:RimJ/RimL family protein N-acetyltransferase